MEDTDINVKKEAIASTITKKIQTIPMLLKEEETKLGWEREHSRSLLMFLSYEYIYDYDELTIQNCHFHGGHNNNISERERVVVHCKKSSTAIVNIDNDKVNLSSVASKSSQQEIIVTNFQADNKYDNNITDNVTKHRHDINQKQ